MSYLATFSKQVNGEANVFPKWVKSDLTCNQMNQNNANMSAHNTLMQKLDDEQAEDQVLGFNISSIFY